MLRRSVDHAQTGSLSSTKTKKPCRAAKPTGAAMSKFIKPALLGLGLVAGLALTAQAQTAPGPSVANLPPAAQGPRASSYISIPNSGQTAVTPSLAYVGPSPGASTGNMPPRF